MPCSLQARVRRIRLCVERLLGALNEKRKKSLFGSIGTISSSHTLSVPMHLTTPPTNLSSCHFVHISDCKIVYLPHSCCLRLPQSPLHLGPLNIKSKKTSIPFLLYQPRACFATVDGFYVCGLFMLMFVSTLCWPVRWLGRDSEGVGLEQTFLFLFSPVPICFDGK